MALRDHTLLLALVAVVVVAAYAYQHIALRLRRRAFQKEHGCQPAKSSYQMKDPIFNYHWARDMVTAGKENRFLDLVYHRYQKWGATFRSQLFRQPVVMTIEPENVKTLLSVRFKEYGIQTQRKGPIGGLLGEGIFTMDGDFWSRSRHMIRPNFARDQVADLPMFERHVEELLSVAPRDNSTFDLQELFFRLTIDSATEFLFGSSVDSQRRFRDQHLHGSQDPNTAFAHSFNYSQKAGAMRGRLGKFAFMYKDKKDEEAIKVCHEFVGKYVDDALRYRAEHDLEKAPLHEDKYVFLHELARQTSDPKRLRDELLNVLLAGRDTTASLLSNMFFMLAQRPPVWAKLREEVAVLDGQPPSYEQLRGFKYLKYCMNESLRLHPVVPGNARTALQDTVLPLGGGPDGKSPLFVQSGTLVAYHTWAMHRRPDYFGADALEFRPERWESLRPGWEYLPFNGGPRICLGQQYALTEAGYVTVRLAQMWESLESRDETGVWVENLTLTLCGKNGTMVGVRRVGA